MPEVNDAIDCGEEKGYREGFLVDAESGKILKQYPQEVIEAEWKKCMESAFGTAEAVP
jgi:hypothetical protein